MRSFRLLSVAALVAAASLAFSGLSAARSSDAADVAAEAQAYERVDSFAMLTRPHSWHALDKDTVILWSTPWDAYLVELAFPSHDLRFAQVIGVTSVGSRVYAKFDAVKVSGFRYPIDSIYKMTREEARALAKQS